MIYSCFYLILNDFLFRIPKIFTKLYYFEALRGNCTGPMRPADTLTSLIRTTILFEFETPSPVFGSRYEALIKL